MGCVALRRLLDLSDFSIYCTGLMGRINEIGYDCVSCEVFNKQEEEVSLPYLRKLLVLPSCDSGYRGQPEVMSHAVWRRQEGTEDRATGWMHGSCVQLE